MNNLKVIKKVNGKVLFEKENFQGWSNVSNEKKFQGWSNVSNEENFKRGQTKKY